MKNMIYHKLFVAEQRLKLDKQKYEMKYTALESIKNLLNELDHSAELAAADSPEDLKKLLTELKDLELTREEDWMVEELFRRDFEVSSPNIKE